MAGKPPIPGVPDRRRAPSAPIDVREVMRAPQSPPGESAPPLAPDARPDPVPPHGGARTLEDTLLEEIRAGRAERDALKARLDAIERPPVIESEELTSERKGRRVGAWLKGFAGAVGLGALVGAGAIGGRVAQDNPQPAKAAVVANQESRVQALEDWRLETARWLADDYSDRQARERILLAWACARGLRVDDVECATLRTEVPADDALESAPARERAALRVWVTRFKWPPPRKPSR